MGFTQAPALSYSKLGIVEDGDTASQAIPKDAYVIWKGGNYFAKTDILQGARFVVDTNLTAIPDGVVNGIVSLLNNKIGNYGDYDVLFEQAQDNTSHTVPDVNQYRYILVCMLWKEGDGTVNLLVSHTVPLGVFKAITTNGNGIQVETHDNSRHYTHLNLTSDTSIILHNSYGMSSNFVFSAYGIK